MLRRTDEETETLETLSYDEALWRAQEAAEGFENLVKQGTEESYERDESRVEYFVSECMSLLSDRYVITPSE